jgi:hypothetical protein
MKLVPTWLTSPRSTPRGWLIGIGLGFLAYAILLALPVFVTGHEWILLILLGIAFWVGCVAYEHPNPVTGMQNIARLPQSASRGWFVGIVIFAVEARAGGSALNAVLKAHEWFTFGLIPLPWWIGHRAYQCPNPLPALLKDIRAPLVIRIILWAVVAALALLFADPIKSALDSVLRTDVPSLAIITVFGFIFVGWTLENITHELKNGVASLNSSVASLESNVDSLESETRELTALLQDISAGLQRIDEQTEQMEERAAADRADQRRQMSELLQLTEAVLAHQPPAAEE